MVYALARIGSREDVAIVDVWQRESRDELLEALDHTIRNRAHHELAGTSEMRGREVRSLLDDVREALVENHRRPSRANHARASDPNQELAKWRRIQNTRVVEDDNGTDQ